MTAVNSPTTAELVDALAVVASLPRQTGDRVIAAVSVQVRYAVEVLSLPGVDPVATANELLHHTHRMNPARMTSHPSGWAFADLACLDLDPARILRNIMRVACLDPATCTLASAALTAGQPLAAVLAALAVDH